MKTFFSQNRILIWFLIFLLVLNIAAIGTIIYYKGKEKTMISSPVIPAMQREGRTHPQGRFMKEILELDDEQFARYGKSRYAFHLKVKNISFELRENRMELFGELKKTNPDMEKIQEISKEIGQLHTQINIETGNYYLQVKEICNPEQREKLHDFFIRTLDRRERLTSPGPKHGREQRNLRYLNVD